MPHRDPCSSTLGVREQKNDVAKDETVYLCIRRSASAQIASFLVPVVMGVSLSFLQHHCRHFHAVEATTCDNLRDTAAQYARSTRTLCEGVPILVKVNRIPCESDPPEQSHAPDSILRLLVVWRRHQVARIVFLSNRFDQVPVTTLLLQLSRRLVQRLLGGQESKRR